MVRNVDEKWVNHRFATILFCVMATTVAAISSYAQSPSDSLVPMHRYAPAVGFDIGAGWRSNGESGPQLDLMYRDALGSVDLEAILYQQLFNNDRYSLGHFGFGFGFLIFLPEVFGHRPATAGLEPMIGVDFTVWSTTLGVGIPVGAEYYIPLVQSWDACIGASIEPQFNLNVDPNTVHFDLLFGLRYH